MDGNRGNVGVLTARVRVEEKQLLEALTKVGLVGKPLLPTNDPLPLTPSPAGPSVATDGQLPALIIDRCRDRAVASAVLPVWRARGVKLIDAGLAATGNRLMMATALEEADVPRPVTQLVCGETAALHGLARTGYPATLLPLLFDQAPIQLLDQDSAEAIFEHRNVLGGSLAAIGLLQSGGPPTCHHLTVFVAGGKAAAASGLIGAACTSRQVLAIAEAAAAALRADAVGIDLAITVAGPVVWDVQPVPDFRDLTSIEGGSAADAIAALAGRRLGATSSWMHDVAIQMTLTQVGEREAHPPREVADGVALSA